MTADLGFGNEIRFPPASHHGGVVARFPNEVSVKTLVDAIVSAILGLPEDLAGCTVIVEPDRIRIRGKGQQGA